MATQEKKDTGTSVEEKLRALYELQCIDKQIEEIRVLRGELPLEVQDLEDEIAGLETRLKNVEEEVEDLDKMIATRRNEIKEAESLISKYKEQQDNVRNNREFDSLSKEIEYQKLEIELAEKRIKEHSLEIEKKKHNIESAQTLIQDRTMDLTDKKNELDEIVGETKKEEEDHIKQRQNFEKMIEERLLSAYKKIRKNARNKVAIAPVERDACGGCFNKIPPQRQLDIQSKKKVIVCEYCGRILVDKDMADEIEKRVMKEE